MKAEEGSVDFPGKATMSRSRMGCLSKPQMSNTSTRVPTDRTAAFMAANSSRWASNRSATTTTTLKVEASNR